MNEQKICFEWQHSRRFPPMRACPVACSSSPSRWNRPGLSAPLAHMLSVWTSLTFTTNLCSQAPLWVRGRSYQPVPHLGEQGLASLQESTPVWISDLLSQGSSSQELLTAILGNIQWSNPGPSSFRTLSEHLWVRCLAQGHLSSAPAAFCPPTTRTPSSIHTGA